MSAASGEGPLAGRALGVWARGRVRATRGPGSFLSFLGEVERELHLLGVEAFGVEQPPHLETLERAGAISSTRPRDELQLGPSCGSSYSPRARRCRGRPASRAAFMAPRMPASFILSASPRDRSAVSASSGGSDGRKERPGQEGGVLLRRRRDELGHPLVHLPGAVVGDLVDGPLGPLALPDGARRLDEALLLERSTTA